jgi:predicted kinase
LNEVPRTHLGATVARLIMLNGPPAIGKSTIAARYVHDHPMALDLDLDRIRSLLGRWRDDRTAAGLATRAIGLAAARAHLHGGHDVIVPQLLTRPELLDSMAEVAQQTGAEFIEIVLLDAADSSVRRFAERTDRGTDPAHVELGAIVAADGGEAVLRSYHHRLVTFLTDRPNAIVIESVDGDEEATYRRVLAVLRSDPVPGPVLE